MKLKEYDPKEFNPERIESGIYLNVPEDVYFSIPALHNSALSEIINKSEKHALHYIQEGSAPSKSQKIGSMLHMALLEPQRFKREVVPYLSGDGRTKRVRQSKKAVKRFLPNASHYVKYSKWSEFQTQAEEAKNNEIGDRIFSPKHGHSEVTMLVEDPDTGLPLKCRWDYINFKIKVGLDYKTTRNAKPSSFIWDIWKYGYYRQVAFYRYIAKLLGLDLHTQLILAQEKKPPYVAVWNDLTETALEKGLQDAKEAIGKFYDCFESGEFKGYVNPETGRNILRVDLPEKAYQ